MEQIKLHNLHHDFPKLFKVYPSLYLAQIKMRIFFPRAIPSANYSLSIALQENALRVTCLTRGSSGSAAGEPELLQRRPAHQPW